MVDGHNISISISGSHGTYKENSKNGITVKIEMTYDSTNTSIVFNPKAVELYYSGRNLEMIFNDSIYISPGSILLVYSFNNIVEQKEVEEYSNSIEDKYDIQIKMAGLIRENDEIIPLDPVYAHYDIN